MDVRYFAARLKSTALRLSKLIELNAPPLLIVKEKEILDNQYREWEKRAFVTHEPPNKVQ